jgi:hypothetical protein
MSTRALPSSIGRAILSPAARPLFQQAGSGDRAAAGWPTLRRAGTARSVSALALLLRSEKSGAPASYFLELKREPEGLCPSSFR